MISELNDSRRIWLPDGRRLGYLELGDPGGKLVVLIAGYPGSRLMAHLFTAGLGPGIRLVGVDRPGMGLSDFAPDWQMQSFAGDLLELARCLGADRFAVLGWSGGTPYAAGCAYHIPELLSACGLIACMAPPEMEVHGAMARNQVWRTLARNAPWSLGFMVWLLYGRLGHEPARFREALVKMQSEISEPDRQAYSRPEIMDIMAAGMAEAFRQGRRGQAYEARLLYRPWGFRLEDIHFDPVFLWQGEQDRNIPPAVGRAIAAAIPGCRASFYPEEGHLSILANRSAEILDQLLA